MNLRETRKYEMFMRVDHFGVERAERIPGDTLAGQKFVAVRVSVRQLAQHAAARLSGEGASLVGTVSKATARASLRDTMRWINRTARGPALDTPGVHKKFRMPRVETDIALLNGAMQFARDLQPLDPRLVQYGLSETIVDELAGDIAEFEEAMKARASGRGLHAKSRVGVRRAIASGMAAVRHLDVLVPNLLRDDPLEMEAWKTARHIVRLPQAADAAAPAADAAAATPPAAPGAAAPTTRRKKTAA